MAAQTAHGVSQNVADSLVFFCATAKPFFQIRKLRLIMPTNQANRQTNCIYDIGASIRLRTYSQSKIGFIRQQPDPFLLLPFSTARSVVFGGKLGWVKSIAFVRYAIPVEHQVSILWL